MFQYVNNLDAVVTLLKNSNTTSAAANLSLSLTSGQIDNDNIVAHDIDIVSLRADRFPCISVRINNKSEDFATMGRTGVSGSLKTCDVSYDITAFYRKDGANEANADFMDDVYRIARNIEAALREDITLSGTALWAQPVRTDFVGPFENNGIWLKGVNIELAARYQFK